MEQNGGINFYHFETNEKCILVIDSEFDMGIDAYACIYALRGMQLIFAWSHLVIFLFGMNVRLAGAYGGDETIIFSTMHGAVLAVRSL
jgi:hypothetical protein